MNPQRDKGNRAELEACRLLSGLTGWKVQRTANAGVREDIGDLIGIPSTTVQVSAVQPDPGRIWARAREKTGSCADQQRRHGATHGVTLLRIDRGPWRALCTAAQIEALGYVPPVDTLTGVAPGSVIHWAPFWSGWWTHVSHGVFVASVEQWAQQIIHTDAGRPAA